MAENTYFLAYTSYIASVEQLNDEECGRLFRALLLYAADSTLPDLPGNEKFIFPQIKYQIDRDRDNYRKKCEQARKNIEKRWNKDKLYGRIRADTNDKDKDKDKDKENDKDKDMESESESDKETPSPEVSSLTPAPPPTLKNIEDYCKRRNLNVNPRHFFDYYEGKNWQTAEGKEIDDWYSLIETWHKKEKPLSREAIPAEKGSFDTDDFFSAALSRSYGTTMSPH